MVGLFVKILFVLSRRPHPVRRRPAALLRWSLACACVALGVALIAPPASAVVDRGGAELRGQVTDQAGAVLAGADVRIFDRWTKLRFRTQSDARGFYRFPYLPVGEWSIEVGHAGYATVLIQEIQLDAARVRTLDFSLEATDANEAVTSSDAVPLVPIDVGGGTVVDRVDLEHLPLRQRRLDDVLDLMQRSAVRGPGANLGAGVDRLRALPAELSTEQIAEPPLLATEEVVTRSRQPPVELGGPATGVVTMVTRRGRKETQGSAFVQRQDSSLADAADADDARDASAGVEEDVVRDWLGVALGGPLSKKAHGFVAWEHAEGEIRGEQKTPSGEISAGRLDTSSDRVAGQVSGEVAKGHFARAVFTRQDEESDADGDRTSAARRAESLDVSLHSLVGARAYHGLRLSWGDVESAQDAATAPSARGAADLQRVRDDVHLWRPGHDLRFGAEWSSSQSEGVPAGDLMDEPARGPWSLDGSSRAVYVQDDWRPSGRLALLVGARWDRVEADVDADLDAEGATTLERDDVAPRLGFVWDVAGDGRHLLRGGAGRYLAVGPWWNDPEILDAGPTDQATLGWSWQLDPILGLAIDVFHVEADEVDGPSGAVLFDELASDGLELSVRGRLRDIFQFRMHYMYSSTDVTTDGTTDPGVDLEQLGGDDTGGDMRDLETHRVAVSGVYFAPAGFRFALVYRYRADRGDLDLPGLGLPSDLPALPGDDDADIETFSQLDLRVAKDITLGRDWHLEVIAEVFNVFDRDQPDLGGARTQVLDGAGLDFDPLAPAARDGRAARLGLRARF